MKNAVAGNLHEMTEKLAYEFWEFRGCPIGSPETDWYAAEKYLASCQPKRDFSLISVQVEPNEEPYHGQSAYSH
jgi:hypothetical protein